jgi:hypothetical protein
MHSQYVQITVKIPSYSEKPEIYYYMTFKNGLGGGYNF